MNRRASCVGTFEVFEATHVALRTLLAFSQPVNCIFWPIGMLNWLVAASKLHKHGGTCCTAEWPFYSCLILCTRCNFSCNLQRYSTLERCKIGKYTFPSQFANIFWLYRYVTRTNVSFFDPSPNDQRTEHSCAYIT